MTVKHQGTRVKKAERDENPLISNRQLRHIYTSLIQVRLFEEHLSKLLARVKPGKRHPSNPGEEACRVSALIELSGGDLISDVSMNSVTELILGAEVRALLQRSLGRLRSEPASTSRAGNIAQQLPPVTETKERLGIAMGAALALKTANQGNIVLAFVNHREMRGNAWSKILSLARRLELPMIFVVLPALRKRKKASTMIVCDRARVAGVPGIPVDSADAIAMFRIVQESLGRTRGGDGPVVIECVMYRLSGQPTLQVDPIHQLRTFLLERGVANQAWLDSVGKTFLQRLGQANR